LLILLQWISINRTYTRSWHS